ncbi:histidine phosphatase family protein [Streptomyces venezuelae]|uniref:SixA phosphatase family protein n=1 Tax=Streptomyces venezuelae TaxID=54571 RepID=UPI00123E3486|nr:histidine phosphatase family protein [Streptomyces venezuelae]QES12299.1 histidine phosphatase family protein [Streptomyces venezuelae]
MSPETDSPGTGSAGAGPGARLLLVRHAKAEPKGRTEDFDRKLRPRGRAEAAETGRWLERSPYRPELVLCSPARRARKTWRLVEPELTDPPPTVYDERLYNAAPDELVTTLADHGAGLGVLALVGHNPGLHQLAAGLCGQGPPELLERLRAGFPTAGVVVVDLAGGWDGLAPGRGTLVAFWTGTE